MKVLKTSILLPFLAMLLLAGADVPSLENPISEKYISKNLRKGHPKLVYTSRLVDEVKTKVKTDPVTRNLYSAIKMNADAVYGEPLLERRLIGRRLLSTSREFLYRVNMLGIIYLVDEEQKALERINEELIAVCNFPDWNPSHFLDVAEMAMGVALAVDWTQGNLPKSTLELAKKSLIEKAILPSWPEDGKTWHLSKSTNNWNQVCAGGLIAASIIIADEDLELAARTIHRSLEGLPNALVAYSPDGVYPEGSTYWGYATIYSVVTASMLESALGNDFGHWEYSGFRESATFRVLANAPSGWYYNYFDCGDKRSVNGDVTLAWFAYKTGDAAFFEKERFLQPVEEMDRLSRFTGASIAWISQFREKETRSLPTAWKGEGPNPIAIFKSDPSDPHGYYLGCKGGRASVSHGNMDAGSFVFELNGVRWVVDPGNQGYHDLEKTGFNLWGRGQDSDRWTLLTKNNFGHSTITVNNRHFICDAFAPLTGFREGEQPQVSFDLSAVYGENMESANRTFRKEGAGSLLIEDRLVLTEKTEIITWQLLTTSSVEIIEGGAILSQDGKQLKLENLSHPDLMVSVVSLDPPPLELDRRIEGLKRIEIRIPAWTIENGSTTLKVRLSEY
jgi:hypothetical protein